MSIDPAKDDEFEEVEWNEEDHTIDKALGWVYGGDSGSGQGRSMKVNEWLRDIDLFFPPQVASVLQKDAVTKFGLELLMKDDSFIKHIIPDIHLAVAILKMKGLLPDQAKHKARLIIDELAKKLIETLSFNTTAAIGRAMRSPLLNRKPKYNHIHWHKTIYKNLHTYLPDTRSVIPEKLIGRQMRQKSIDTIYILIDQSGSMYESLIYAAIYGCIFSRIPALNTHLILFDTEIADVSGQLSDPVDVLFSTHMGGGTDIGKALQYALQSCPNPERSLLVLISDLDETEDVDSMLATTKIASDTFKKILVILALNQEGKATWNKEIAEIYTALDITCVASTPEQFPELCAREIILSRS